MVDRQLSVVAGIYTGNARGIGLDFYIESPIMVASLWVLVAGLVIIVAWMPVWRDILPG